MHAQTKPPLSRFGLRFLDARLESEFRRDLAGRILGQSRLSLLLGALLYLLLGLQDPWFFPGDFYWVWALRGAVAFCLLGGVAVSYLPAAHSRFPTLLIPLTLVAGAGPLVMIAQGSLEVMASYYLGLTLVVVWCYTFSGLRFLPAVGVNVLLGAAYLLVSLPVLPESPVWVATNLSNFLAASLLTGFAACLIERQRRVLFYQASLLDAERRSQEQLALSDHLTGLPNRAYFERRMAEAVHRARRNDHAFALIFVDIDDFKPINDAYGHRAGDQVLAVLARGLEEALRGNDTVARLGGDEFVVLLEEVGGRAKVAKVAEKLRAAVSRTVKLRTGAGEVELQVSASVGIALFPEDASSAADLLQAADAAMYRDKYARRRARAETAEQEQRPPAA